MPHATAVIDHLWELLPTPEPVRAGDHERVDDHAGTFSRRAALSPSTSTSSSARSPA